MAEKSVFGTDAPSDRQSHCDGEGGKPLTDRELLESISRQLGELVHHVAEVRKSNQTLESEMRALRADVDDLRARVGKLEEKLDVLTARVETLEQRFDALERRVEAVDKKIDDRSDTVAGKFDHFLTYLNGEIARNRVHLEEERYIREGVQRKTEERLDAIERRLDRLEAAALPG